MKTVGALLVILSCAVLGLARAEAGRKRLRLLRALADSLRALEGELCGSLRPVRAALESLSARKDAAASFFRSCLEYYGAEPLRVTWEKAALSLDGLRREEAEKLAALGAVVGRREAERQGEALRQAAACFEAAAEKAGERAAAEYRLRAALGLGSGLLLAILAA